MINDSTIVNVYNYNEGIITVPSHLNGMGHTFIQASRENPCILPLTFSEIRFINGQSQIFREGFLRFEPEVEEEVYKALQIHNWQDILSETDIKDIILNPTKEKLEKIIKITSTSLFERVRNVLIKMKNVGLYDISNRVVETIEYRYQELYRNRMKSDLVINYTKQETDDTEKLKAEIEAKLRAEIEAEMKKKYGVKEETNTQSEDTKKVGRPPKNQ